MTRPWPLSFHLVLALLASPLWAQEVRDSRQFIRERYTKTEHKVAMRDGVKLHTVVYAPKEAGRKFPLLMMRTPYGVGPYGPDQYRTSLGPSIHYLTEGYIFVYQDARGCFLSEGTFVNMTPHVARKKDKEIDESTDTHDTIDWLLKNVPNHNGRVGQWGVSYPGFYAAAGMIDAHPALKAVSPQAPIADWWYDDFHHHGAFFLPHAFGFFSAFGLPRPAPVETRPRRREFPYGTPDGYQFYLELGPLKNADGRHLKGQVAFWNEMCDHPNYDEFWQARNLLPHLKKVAPAVLTVGGWFDAENLYGPLKMYRAIEKDNPGIWSALVMGPWVHGGWERTGKGDSLGDIAFGAPTADYFQTEVERPFFNHFLKDDRDPRLPEATVFETGKNRWRRFDAWPPKTVQQKTLYVREGGRLDFSPPAQERGHDEYVSDPARPVPHTAAVTTGMNVEYMIEDQRFAARRPDVLVYQTDVLEDDLTLAGPLLADLRVSTSGTDSDWVVKLIDVFPGDYKVEPKPLKEAKLGGYQMMVRSEVIRGRFRNDPSRPEAFVPDRPTQVRLELLDVLHTFRKGHRLMVQVQSSWFPLVDRNPQTFVPNIYKADEKDFVKATQRLYRSKSLPSSITLGVLPPEK